MKSSTFKLKAVRISRVMEVIKLLLIPFMAWFATGLPSWASDEKLLAEIIRGYAKNLPNNISVTYVVERSGEEGVKVTYVGKGEKFRYERRSMVKGGDSKPMVGIASYDGKTYWVLAARNSVLYVGSEKKSFKRIGTELGSYLSVNPIYNFYYIMSRRGGFNQLSHLSHLSGQSVGISDIWQSGQMDVFHKSDDSWRLVSAYGTDMGKFKFSKTGGKPLEFSSTAKGEGEDEEYNEVWKAMGYERVKISSADWDFPSEISYKGYGEGFSYSIKIDRDSIGPAPPEASNKSFFQVAPSLANQIVDLDFGDNLTKKPSGIERKGNKN